MGGILNNFTVMQQNDWAGRRFFTAQDRRTGQVVYLVAESVHGLLEPYSHPSLPPVQLLTVEEDVRWLIGSPPEGDTLEDLRRQAGLTEADLLSALLSVLDGLATLSLLDPPPVPAYLDPSCVRRDRLGRWTIDYLALAHAPEARSQANPPLGVYPFGVLLFWLATGQLVRRTRVPVDRVEHDLSPTLLFILVKCLGRNYPSLAELRTDIERAGREHEFRSIAKQPAPLRTSAPPSATHIPVPPRGGPHIPANDRPWALPPRPEEGFRKYVVTPPPNPKAVRSARVAIVGLVAALLLAVGTGAAINMGWIFPPADKKVALMPDYGVPDVPIGPELPEPVPPSEQYGPPVPAPVEAEPEPAPDPPAVEPPVAAPPRQTPPPTRPIQPPPAPRQPVASPAPAPPVEAPEPQPPSLPTRPPRKAPEPGSDDDQDSRQGGLPVVIHYNNTTLGWAYVFPHPTSPYISINTFNRLFGKKLFWVPHEGAAIRILNGDSVVVTRDYEVVKGRVWLKLSPFLQEALGVRLEAYNQLGLYFATM